MTVFIDKFWIEGVLTEAYPRFIKEGGADLDGSGAIGGKEVFGDLDRDGTVGDRDDYKEYLRQNRFPLSQKAPFFKWGERLSVDNRVHQTIYLESDIHPNTQIASAYAFIANLVERVGKEIGQRKLLPQGEAQAYYEAMKGAGIVFKAQDDSSLVGNIDARQLDCDTSSFVAMAVGDERGVRLQPVVAPKHVFLRGKNRDGSELNIDYGVVTSNESYHVDPNLVRRGIYLKTLDDSQLESLFLTNRGVVLEKLGRDEEALASYDRAIAIDPNNAHAHYNRGVVLGKLGRSERP